MENYNIDRFVLANILLNMNDDEINTIKTKVNDITVSMYLELWQQEKKYYENDEQFITLWQNCDRKKLKSMINKYSKRFAEFQGQNGIKTNKNYLVEMIASSPATWYRNLDEKEIKNIKNYHISFLRLCLLCRLDILETNELLFLAGTPLNLLDKTDMTIYECIKNKIFDIYEVDDILNKRNLPRISKEA